MKKLPHKQAWKLTPRDEEWLVSAVKVARFALSTDLIAEHKKALLDAALWATVRSGKYQTQYRSVEALATTDLSLLRHEHVFTRKDARARMVEHPERVDDIIREAVGCVVTKSEHARLNRFDKTHRGWDRYLAASVDVIDMATGQPYITNGGFANKETTR